jgi:hypothetical protein
LRQAINLIRQKFQKLSDAEGDVGERLFLMQLHGRLLLVFFLSMDLKLIEKLGKPAKALSMLIRCVHLSDKYNCRLVYLSAVSALAKVMNELTQYYEAYRILGAVMPYVQPFSMILTIGH